MAHTEEKSAPGHRGNLARYFVEHRQVGWALLAAALLWGVYGYRSMPKRKDPEIPVRVALAACPWPGMKAERVEELVTRRLEEAASGNTKIDKIETTTRDSVAVMLVYLQQNVSDTVEQFADIGQRVTHIPNLPSGAGPVTWVSDFGDTAALMLTVASPKVGHAELQIRGQALRGAIEKVRSSTSRETSQRVSALICAPQNVPASLIERPMSIFAAQAQRDGVASDVRAVSAAGCSGVDFTTERDDAQLRAYSEKFVRERLGDQRFHPDAWGPLFIRDPSRASESLAAVDGDLYSYRQLDDFTDTIARTLQGLSKVSKVSRSGVLSERIFVEYAQERLAALGLHPSKLRDVLAARNTALPGGVFEAGDRHMVVDPSPDDARFDAMGDTMLGASSSGAPVRLRDVAQLSRSYENPARYLNYLVWRDRDGRWQRSRAVTLAVQMRSGEQIAAFGAEVQQALARVQRTLPPDLIVERTSDQPRQVDENVTLFMQSLYEAIALVVLVAFVGFWSWRSALLMATSIPLTLAMTFGASKVLGIDIQQVSIATLIIALGLLVDMPVVAGDAIERELGAGTARSVAAWLGPTRLLKAIAFGTLTNVVAYLPFLMLSGDTGRFLYALPVVMTVTLVAALLVAMTFIPLVAVHLVKPPSRPPPTIEERRSRGFTGWYYRTAQAALRHRFAVLGGSLILLAGGGIVLKHLHTQFFPTDLSYFSYVDVWLPPDAPLASTDAAAAEAERVIRAQAEAFGKEHGKPRVLRTLTTFVGGGGPRFWFSVQPEQQQLNYAQILIEVTDKHFTRELVEPLQAALSRGVAGARVDVRQLETGKPVGIPVSIRLSGPDIPALRGYARELAAILRKVPTAARVRDNWDEPALSVKFDLDDERAGLSGLTRYDVASSSVAALSGLPVGTYREGDKQIPILARLRLEDRAQLADLDNLYVFSSSRSQRVPLRQISRVERDLSVSKIVRRNQFRTITVSAYAIPGTFPSQVLEKAKPAIDALQARLPPSYRLEIAGEYEEQTKGFGELAVVMLISVALIYFALVFQFDSAVKPLVVFAAIPYGMMGAVVMLAIAGQPFGFMGFLGVASLVGVIVSHVIVLFDFIEEAHQQGRPLEEALLDAGIVRLRPVLITVGATVLGLFPLALHGGPLWEPLCYAQIGGLSIATAITLVLVPVIYTIFVRDLKIIHWEGEG